MRFCQNLQTVISASDRRGHSHRIIGAAIVHNQDLGIAIGKVRHHLLECGLDSIVFVENRDDNGDIRLRRHFSCHWPLRLLDTSASGQFITARLAADYNHNDKSYRKKGPRMITAYLYKSCSSCRKAEALLADLDADVRVIEYFKHRLSVDDLRAILAQTGMGVTDVLSTRSTPYKEMDLADKDLGDDEILELISAEPRLLKRPLLVSGEHAVVGYNEAAIRELAAMDAQS